MGKETIVLLGLKNSGKSTLGKMLADELNYTFYDTDAYLEQMTGSSARKLYAEKGVGAFMMAEENACEDIAKKIGSENMVISTGGGICDNPPALERLRAANTYLFLENDVEVSVKRIVAQIVFNEEDGTFKNLPSFLIADKPKNLKDVERLLTERFTERYSRYEAICDQTAQLVNESGPDAIKKNLALIKSSIGK